MKRGIVEWGLYGCGSAVGFVCIAERIGYDTNDWPTNPTPVHTSSLVLSLVELDLGHAEGFHSLHDKSVIWPL